MCQSGMVERKGKEKNKEMRGEGSRRGRRGRAPAEGRGMGWNRGGRWTVGWGGGEGGRSIFFSRLLVQSENFSSERGRGAATVVNVEVRTLMLPITVSVAHTFLTFRVRLSVSV